ncbi:tRNA (5-methylaminomethyl-2-thiouridine)(34)-methyltransferase MnmD [Pseudopelagicola sp. nBUS_20]|uniref:tRNA (5-methylaminomethyl-2-thiouridine)(34)-methyltransferase MnmD n=1 Tax=Pseudopelagicola sp. nBUS_20 TaxID=3395317 RepID=UPI003EB7353D
MIDQNVNLDWRDGNTPVSTQFDDPYFSLEDGLEETRHVFLAGNMLPDRFRPEFHIAELGFGTGLNLLTSWMAWDASGQNTPLQFTSFEAFPMSAPDMRQALVAFPELYNYAERLVQAWSEDPSLSTLAGIDARVILGDARKTLVQQDFKADAWFLDGFSPAKNPELWGANLMLQVSEHTKFDGTAATYTSAGLVRRNLAEAGFNITRVAGYGRKRHMIVAQKRAS